MNIKNVFFVVLFCISTTTQSFIIIPLGQSCVVSLALRENNLRQTAYPFDWIVSPFPSLYKALDEDFKNFLLYDSLTIREYDKWGVLDYYGFHFVHDFPTLIPNDTAVANLIDEDHIIGGHLCDNWKDFHPKVYSKYLRRINRFKDALSGSDVVYFIRHSDITQDEAILLRDLLFTKYPSLNFILIVLGRTNDVKTKWNLSNIENFYLDEREPLEWKIFFESLLLSNQT